MAGPLAGIRVLDLSRWVAGPHCALVLGDLGADVVKVESAPSGEVTRTLPPHLQGESIYFMVHNRNKRGITLNFRHPKGPDLLRRLSAHADVLIENFRPGVMAAMGCSYEILGEVNPRLVMASVTGFGQEGPLSQRPAFDYIAQAMSGLQMMNGSPEGPPSQVGFLVADYTAALYATIGVLAALRRRDETGRGQLVDVALLDSLLSVSMNTIPEYLLLGRLPGRQGSRGRSSAPINTFKTRDGWVQIAAGNDSVFPKLLKAMGQEDRLQDPRFATVSARLKHVEETEAFVAEWVAVRTSREIDTLMAREGVPCAPVCTIADVVENPQVRHRGQIVEVEHPKAGPLPMHGVTIKLSESPGSIERAAPMLGEHNQEIYGEWLGLTAAEVAAFQQEGAI